jgi:hypothetical protein
MINETEYLNSDNTTKGYVIEPRKNKRLGNGYNGNFGIELFLDKSTSWTNTINYRKK